MTTFWIIFLTFYSTGFLISIVLTYVFGDTIRNVKEFFGCFLSCLAWPYILICLARG
jgi:hypothetical protein